MKRSTFKYFGLLTLFSALFSSCIKQNKVSPIRKDSIEAVFASGHIEQENQYTVFSTVEGTIVSLRVKEGDSAKINQLIATVKNDVPSNQLEDALAVYEDAVKNVSPNAPKIQQIETQIVQAKRQLALDKENYMRFKKLRETNSVSQLEFEKAELQYHAAQNNLSALEETLQETIDVLKLNVERSRMQVNTYQSLLGDYELITPNSGIVNQVFKKQGELTRKGEAIAEIGSGDYLIKLYVSEDDIAKISKGQSVAVTLNTYPNSVFDAKVTKIHPAFDKVEQSYVLEAHFEQLPEKMFSGTQLQANIVTRNRKNVLFIPTDYLINGNTVLLESGEEKRIETGISNGEWTEVTSGITAQEVLLKPKR
ncbi:efflux RND transporter periplasmic adaptor subunit [Cyclobacterium marinum]|nr:HlyD family efflux transporter periplasmic adaptor subunit [Cyclobacterium marinum]